MDSSDQNSSLIADEITLFDPDAIEGYVESFNKEIPLTFKNGDEKTVSMVVRIRVLQKGDSENLESIKIEMFNDEDLTFFQECIIEKEQFSEMREKTLKNCRIEFEKMPSSIIELLENSVRKAEQYSIQYLEKGGSGSLLFMQSLRLRSVEIFRLEFQASSDEFTKKQAQFRFRKLQIELQNRSAELDRNYNYIMQRRSSLAHTIKQNVARKLALQ